MRFPAQMMRSLGSYQSKRLIPNVQMRMSLAFADRIQKVVMDYRIGITGAQGSGKTTLARYIDAHYGIPYVDAALAS
jgi:pantothenate kinase-related protein Tda10